MRACTLVAIALWVLLFLVACGDRPDTTPTNAGNSDTTDTTTISPDGESTDAELPDSGVAKQDTTPVDTTPFNDVPLVDSGESPEDIAGLDTLPVEDTQTDTEETFSLFLPSFDLPSGEETTKCVLLRLDNDDSIYVKTIETTLAEGSHHLIVYRSEASEEQPIPKTCTPFTETLSLSSAPLIISQIQSEKLEFPAGVAIEFSPHQMIRLEAHFINYTANTLSAEASVIFSTMPEASVIQKADMLFYGDLDIGIPAFSEGVVGPTWLPVDAGTNIFAITGHTHKHGTDVSVWHGVKDDIGESVYAFDIYDWDEPPVEFYDPPLQFAEGEGLRIQCTYENTTSSGVGFGESADDEMCFFWAYYWPAEGFQICASHPLLFDIVGKDNICCPEDQLCGFLLGFAGNL